MYNDGKTSKALWAVLNQDGEVAWTRGGSSSSPKLMVYESQEKAIAALRGYWSPHNENIMIIRQIYPC